MAWVILGKKSNRKITIAMAEPTNQEVKSKRDALRERMLKRNPELNVEDPEAMSGGISDYLDELDGQIGEYRGREEKLTNMMNADPRSAHFLSSWANGEDPMIALVKLFGEDIRTILDDPESEASKELARRTAEGQAYNAEADENIEKTKGIIAQWKQDNGLSDDEANEVLDFLEGVLQDSLRGIVSRESLDMGLKAIRHDEDVAEAASDAEVKGRNAKITEKLRLRSAGDGTVALAGKNGRSAQKPGVDLGALDRMSQDDIWSRGDEKRTRHSR